MKVVATRVSRSELYFNCYIPFFFTESVFAHSWSLHHIHPCHYNVLKNLQMVSFVQNSHGVMAEKEKKIRKRSLRLHFESHSINAVAKYLYEQNFSFVNLLYAYIYIHKYEITFSIWHKSGASSSRFYIKIRRDKLIFMGCLIFYSFFISRVRASRDFVLILILRCRIRSWDALICRNSAFWKLIINLRWILVGMISGYMRLGWVDRLYFYDRNR